MPKWMLEATSRPVGKGAARRARRVRLVPGVVYGAGMEPVPVAVDELALGQVVRGGGLHRVLPLRITGEPARMVLIQYLQRDHIGNNILAVDFHQVDMQRPIRIRVPVHLAGEGVLAARGQVVGLHETEVEVACLPFAVPDSINIDVSHLHPGQHISVGELPLLEGVRYLDDPQRVLVTVASAAIAEAPATPPPASDPPA